MPSILGFKFHTFNCIFLLYFIGKLFTKNQNFGFGNSMHLYVCRFLISL